MKSLVEYINESVKQIIPPAILKSIEYGMKHGYIIQKENGKEIKYGISRQNLLNIEGLEEFDLKLLEKAIEKFEKEGIKFKFEKDEEWKKAGYEDPNKD